MRDMGNSLSLIQLNWGRPLTLDVPLLIIHIMSTNEVGLYAKRHKLKVPSAVAPMSAESSDPKTCLDRIIPPHNCSTRSIVLRVFSKRLAPLLL